MTNPITTAPAAQANTASGIPGGIAIGDSELASPSTTFVDFLMAHIDATSLSKEEISAITQDLSDGEISQDSPIFSIIGKLSEQFTLEQNSNLSVGNELFIRELSSLFVGLDKQGDINLSNDVVSQLNAISTGEAPAEDFIALIQSTDLFGQLRDAIQEERVHGLAKTIVKPEDLHDIAEEKIEEILAENGDDVGGIEIVLKRLETLLEKIRARIANANNPRSEEALTNVAEHVANLITRFESKLDGQTSYIIDDLNMTLNKAVSTKDGVPSAVPAEGFTPTRHALLKTARGQKTAATNGAQAEQAAGVTLNAGTASTAKKAKGNSFSLAPTGSNGESAWLNPIDGDLGFDPKIDAKAIAADQLQNTVRAAKASTTQSNARMMLPPSPAAQQVMVHIQKNANNQSRMNIQLNPAELGRVEVRLTVNSDGRTTATVLADRPETLQLLQKDSAHLEKALQNAGLELNSQDLSFNLRGDGDSNDFNSNRRFSRHNKNSNNLSIDGTQLSGAQIDAAIFSKYSVNYKA